MELKFTKMHGLGNDFMVVDRIRQRFELDEERVRRLANRRFGVGFDQLLVVEAPSRPGVDFRFRIYNADGGEVEHCGNGARCFALYVRREGLSTESKFDVETASGSIQLCIEEDGQVTVDMGTPEFEPGKIPFEARALAAIYDLDIDGGQVPISAVSMGNPHAVVLVADVEMAPVETLGPRIERHGRFPHRTNAGFMEIVDRGHIRLRVFERGVGETLACGTGACAAVAVGRSLDYLGEKVLVDLPGGRLVISWSGGEAPLRMTGPGTFVFDGSIRV